MEKLHDLRTSSLTYIETGQLVKRTLTDLTNANIDTETDPKIKKYVTTMQVDSELFDKATLQIHKNEETEVLAELDQERDNSVAILNRQHRVFELSKTPTEITAYKSLKIVFDKYKNIANMNYEAETNAINNLLQDLSEPQYAPHVLTLNLTNYVSRLHTDQNLFDTHFTNRSTGTASKIVYDAREIRKAMLKNYSNYANYVLLFSDSDDTSSYYKDILNIINNIRKYYSDLIATRAGRKKAANATPNSAPN